MFKRLSTYFEGRKQTKAAARTEVIAGIEAKMVKADKIEDPAEKVIALEKVKSEIGAAVMRKEKKSRVAAGLEGIALTGTVAVGGMSLVSIASLMLTFGAGHIRWDNVGKTGELEGGLIAATYGAAALSGRRRKSLESFEDDIKETSRETNAAIEGALSKKDAVTNSVFFLDMLEARPDLKEEFLNALQKTAVPPAAKPQPKKPGNSRHA